MRIHVRPGDYGPCGHYRLIWPALALAGPHHDITIAPRGWPEDGHIPPASVVVTQRPNTAKLVETLRRLRSEGTTIVVDMDDDFSCVPTSFGSAEAAKDYHKHAMAACSVASLVTVTTPALAARYAPHGRVAIIPNMVPQRYLDTPHRDSKDIGWAGSLHTHRGDLDVVGDALRRLAARGAGFRIAGPPEGVARPLGLDADPPGSGHVPIEEWPQAVTRIGIGIAPLQPCEFTNAKSRLKPLEYSALGIPWVASPTPDYIGFHQLGCGLIARHPDEWFGHLHRLLVDDRYRWRLADAGREIAAENTIEGNTHLWTEAWHYARHLDRSS